MHIISALLLFTLINSLFTIVKNPSTAAIETTKYNNMKQLSIEQLKERRKLLIFKWNYYSNQNQYTKNKHKHYLTRIYNIDRIIRNPIGLS